MKKNLLTFGGDPVKINVVDSIMGSGKTQAAINYINSTDTKIMYVTPYLTEVERIIKACPDKHFKQPINYNGSVSKMVNLKHLLDRGENIVTTHALFHNFDDETIELCYIQEYVLIMDEVTDVIDVYPMGKEDTRIMLDNFVEVQENGILKWTETNYNDPKFMTEKHLCEMECLAMYGKELMMWLFPVKIFQAFHESYILTYMFSGQMQKYYYDFNGLDYQYLYVQGDAMDNYHFVTEPVTAAVRYNYKDLIYIMDDYKMNLIGKNSNSLSKAWYERNVDTGLIKKLKNNTANFFNNKKIAWKDGQLVSSWSKNNIWTTFKEYKHLLAGKGYTKGFLPLNIRASNDYQDCNAVAYLINKYFNPYIRQFFTMHNVEVDEDAYAVSEMLQFIWRSAIRQGKPISVYIPSSRMRTLLEQWIESASREDLDEVVGVVATTIDAAVIDIVDVNASELTAVPV
ncbi:MAG: DEAD/DEAH box helicase family protein [Lachnospiraceae bacterium]|nr:DEAD/DEAH box helicase family protein [Lachnospiraceae bacterium]